MIIRIINIKMDSLIKVYDIIYAIYLKNSIVKDDEYCVTYLKQQIKYYRDLWQYDKIDYNYYEFIRDNLNSVCVCINDSSKTQDFLEYYIEKCNKTINEYKSKIKEKLDIELFEEVIYMLNNT